MVALREIEPGEELFVDYGRFYWMRQSPARLTAAELGIDSRCVRRVGRARGRRKFGCGPESDGGRPHPSDENIAECPGHNSA